MHVEYESFSNSRNVNRNLEMHLTWKLTAIRLQKDTFQKPWNQASVFHLNYSYKSGNVSCLQAVLPKFLADHPPDQVQWKWIEQYFPPSPLNFPNSVFGKCAKYLAKITQMKSYLEKHMFVHLTSKLTSGRNQPRVACVSWTVSPDINWAECEAKHSVQSSAQFKKPPWNTHRQHLPL